MSSIKLADTENDDDEYGPVAAFAHFALMNAQPYVHRYLREHATIDSGFNEQSAAMMAAARLDWVLRQGRRELAGVFTWNEFAALMNCTQQTTFQPEDFDYLPWSLCDDAGIDVAEWQQSRLAPLVEKLGKLSSAQLLKLCDALEQAWKRPSGISVAGLLDGIGLSLLDWPS